MNDIKITSNQFSRTFKIKGVNDKDSLENQIVYITLELYKQVCKEVKKEKDWNYYTERRAYFIGHTIKDVLGWMGFEVEKVKQENPITLNAVIDEKRHINCKIEFNTHKYFVEEVTERKDDSLVDININWGFCVMRGTSTKRIWPFSAKGDDMNLWIGVKSTDPEKELPVELDVMFDSTIHEFVHLMDNIERFYSRKLAFIIAEPLLKRTLTRFFTFRKADNR